MDKQREEQIIKTFFNKRVQDRITFELSSKSKRSHAIHRLCHNYEDILDSRFMIEIEPPNSDVQEVLKVVKSNGLKNNDECYVISLDSEIDGKYLPLTKALESVMGFGLASIVYCVSINLAIFQAEQVIGPPPRFLLKRDYPK